jgi:uncharacterized protein (TIGR02231 family)
MRQSLIAGVAALGLAINAGSVSGSSAADIMASSAIKSVTVFPQGAEIERTATTKVEAGEHIVILRDLPAGLVSDSVRVEGTSTGALEIGAVDVRQFQLSELADPTAAANERRRLQEQLDGLNDQRRGLQAALDAAEQQKRLIQNLANLPTRPAPATGTVADPDWGQLFTLIGERLVAADKSIVATTVEMRALDKKIADVQSKIDQQPGNDEGRTEVKVRIAAGAPGDASFVVRYQVEQAGWAPLYDARLATGTGDKPATMTLARNASIYQSTGEAWKDVALALSTTRPQAGTVAPELTPVAVDFEPPPPPPVAYQAAKPKMMRRQLAPGQDGEQDAAGMVMSETLAEPVPTAPVVVAADIQQATITNAAFQAVYGIPGQQSIESGVGNKRVQIDAPSITPTLNWRTTPKLDPAAYLYAKWTVAADLLLLPGQVALFRDGIYVGQGVLPQLAAGESHELGFGRDDKVIVKYADLGRKAGKSGIISTSKTDSQSFKATLKNLHKQPVTLRVLDQIPVSANEEIKVELAGTTTPPTVRDLDDKRGVLAWDLTLAPDQEQTVAIAYQVSWPNAKSVMYVPREGVWPLATR